MTKCCKCDKTFRLFEKRIEKRDGSGKKIFYCRKCFKLLEDENFKSSIRGLYTAGAKLVNLGKYKEAIKYFDKVLKKNSNQKLALFQKGVSLVKINKSKSAIQCYDKILKNNPENKDAIFLKGVALFEHNEYKKAIECFDLLLQKEPENIMFLINKGLALSKSGTQEQISECFEKILRIDPNNRTAKSEMDIIKNCTRTAK